MNLKIKEFKGNERTNRAILTLSVGLIADFVLFILKMYIGLATNSIAILGDALNNLSDTVACLIAIMSFVIVKKSKGDKLPYGYGRLEYIADFLMSVIVVIVGFVFVYLSIERLVLPYLMTFTWLYFGIIAATVAVKIGMGFFFKYMNKGVNSGVLKASVIDSFTDAGITVMSLIGFSLGKYAKLRLDAIFGLVISGVMIFNGVKLLVQSVRTLLGEKLEEKTQKEIEEICSSYDCVEEIRKINVHRYGAGYVELVVEAVFTKNTAYDIIENTVGEISERLKKTYGFEPKICITR